MDFRLELTPRSFAEKMNHRQPLFLTGSCFTENIGSKFKQHKFSVLENPNGILFNPVSIAKSVCSYIQNRQYTASDLFYQNESWHSWEHHSRFSHPQQQACLQLINTSQQAAHHFLQNAGWLIVTLGSAFVYELKEQQAPLQLQQQYQQVVANCHKVPTDKFSKKLLHPAQVQQVLEHMLAELKSFNPGIRVIFTISPVRHLREGFIENNRSKAVLMQAVHQLVDLNDYLYYFPAYELVIDDLRDYRFYAEDMVHPNYAATQYVWEKLQQALIDEPTLQLMKQINSINAAIHHKPFNPASAAHQQFLQVHYQKLQLLQQQMPYIDFSAEAALLQA
jgi:hypothetical protein